MNIFIQIPLALVIIIAISSVGYIFLYKLKIPTILKVGLSPLFGTFFFTLLNFIIYYFFNVDLTVFSFTVQLLFSLYISFILSKKHISIEVFKKLRAVMSGFSLADKLLSVVIIILVVNTIFQNILWPITSWDAITLYDFRGRILAEEGFSAPVLHEGYYLNYPPYTSILHSYLYLFGISFPSIWYSVLLISLLTCFYSVVSTYQTRTVSFIGVLLLLMTPMIYYHSQIAYTNLSYTIFFSLSNILIWESVRKKKTHLFVPGIILASGATWIRNNDPLILIIFIPILIYFITVRYKALRSSFFLPLLIVPTIAWNSYKLFFLSESNFIGYTGYLNDSITFSALSINFFDSLKYIIQTTTPSIGWLFVISLIVVVYDLWIRKTKISFWIFMSILFGLSILLVGTIILSLQVTWWNTIGGSITRLSMIFSPVLLYICMSSDIWKGNNGYKKKGY